MFDITKLKEIRRKLDLTQHEFAFKAGVSQSLIAKIEANKIDPTYSKVKKIENAIDSLSKHKEKEAKDIMIKNIILAKSEDKISKVIKLMNKYSISQLPVLEKDKVIGLITESSILEKSLENANILKAKDLMIEAPPLISENTKISVVSSLLKYYPLILVSKKGGLKGLITKADLLNSLV